MGMVDRQDLREKAKGVGSSVAGTFKRGAKAAKEGAKDFAETTKEGASRAKKNITGEQDVEVFYNQEAETYLLYVDGEPVDQFDSEMQAKAAAREIMRGDSSESGQSVTQKFKSAATNAAQSFEPSTPESDDTGSPSVPMLGQSDNSGGPQVPMLFTESGDSNEGPSLPFMNDRDTDGPEMPFMNGDTNPDLAFLDSGNGEGPTVPGFAGQQGDGGPQIVALDEESEKPDTDRFPWMY